MKIFNEIGEVISNSEIALNTFEAFIDSPLISKHAAPGQFINILPSLSWTNVMRRPMSIASQNNDQISIIYKAIGSGTNIMKSWMEGDEVDLIGPLGNKWNNFLNKTPILVGGGVGIAPILNLHNHIKDKHIKHSMIMGARCKDEHFIEQNQKSGIILTTHDGSLGIKGTVVNALDALRPDSQNKIFCCGPPKMMEAVKKFADQKKIECNFALETIMACGIGICQGCTVEMKNIIKNNHSYRSTFSLACIDGPIYDSKEIVKCHQ